MNGGQAECWCDEGYVAYDEVCSPDEDLDGIPDPAEYEIAAPFAPILQFGTIDTASGREEHWAVRPTSTGIEIFYALAYYVDAGDDLVGFGHDGDSEFIVVRLIDQWRSSSRPTTWPKQTAPGGMAPRDEAGCTEVQNSYGHQLGRWEADNL